MRTRFKTHQCPEPQKYLFFSFLYSTKFSLQINFEHPPPSVVQYMTMTTNVHFNVSKPPSKLVFTVVFESPVLSWSQVLRDKNQDQDRSQKLSEPEKTGLRPEKTGKTGLNWYQPKITNTSLIQNICVRINFSLKFYTNFKLLIIKFG